jgi:PEP-CTERM motif-containing protein
MTSIFRTSITAAAALFGLALSAQSHATLLIYVDGVQRAMSASNTTVAFSGATTDFTINNYIFGTSLLGGGTLVDGGSGVVSSTGAGTLTLLLVETGVPLSGALSFTSDFLAKTFTGLSVTRGFYLDTSNAGTLTGAMSLGSTTLANALFNSGAISLTGPFSLIEQIVITAPSKGGLLSSQDTVGVPEPMSLGLFGIGLAAVGLMRRRKSR